uniref:Ig-like domain-containing protein n=1 Tax=Astatotilapia calliptera TaxID=8154 RepID=A0A3P8QRY5_ASTCA
MFEGGGGAKPRITTVTTASVSVLAESDVLLPCKATGNPEPNVAWTKVSTGKSLWFGLSSVFKNGTFVIKNIQLQDRGQYLCTAQNRFGSDRMVITLAVQTENKLGKDERKVSVKVGPNAPKIRFKSQSLVTIKLGESAKLSCEATGEPTPRITWISPQKDVIPASSDKFQIMDGGMLLVKKVTLSSEGIYTCLARNSAGDDVKNIKVEAEPQEPFINGVKGRSTTKVLGVSYQTAHLHCRVEGKPEPRVWWVTPYGLSLPAPYLGGRFQVHQNGTLELRGIRKTDEGRYMCLAKNNMGEASLLVEFDVASLAEKPTFSVPNIEILPIKPDGGELILECSARGKPNPEFSWILPNGTLLMPGARLQRFTHYLGNGTLRISRPVPADKGVYRCLAKNVAGQAEKRYALEAGRKPVIRGSTGMFVFFYPKLILGCAIYGFQGFYR